nr:hypothetical protein [Tanacetum cinerariifolium]
VLVVDREIFWERGNEAWFMASVELIRGLADQDNNFLEDDEARGNYIEHHNGLCGDTEDGNFIKGLDEKICQKSNPVLVEEGDGVLDSEGDGVHLSQTNDVIQQAKNLSTVSLTSPQKRKADEFDQLAKRLSKLKSSQTFVTFKSLLKTDVCTKNESTELNPKESKEILNFCSDYNDTSNHIACVSTEAKPSSSSSHPGNDEDASHLDDLMEIDGENAKDDYCKT